MAARRERARPIRALSALGVLLAVVFGSLAIGTTWGNASWTPSLALDLEGGTQIILTPVTTDDSEITPETIAQAIAIIRQRIDGSGVAEAEISSQGGRNIVVGIPGTPSEETLDLVRESAVMNFRPVLAVAAPTPMEEPAVEEPGDAPDAESGAEAEDAEQGAPDSGAPEGGADDGATPEGGTEDDADVEPNPEEAPAEEPENASDLAWLDLMWEEFGALDCTDPANLVNRGGDDPDLPLVTCANDGSVKYVLGPVEVRGFEIAKANSGLRVTSTGVTTNEWVVNIELDRAGTAAFREVTTRLRDLTPPRNQFAITLDGLVVSAPSVQVVIPDGRAEISGGFTQESAATLANQLNFGALPLTFEVQSEEEISATLGAEQLQRGLLAGVIGLVLVFIYMLLQYRVLGLVTVGSLLLAALITFGFIAVLSWTQGYRLSLPGVAGLIVAIGITADSFIVYFERIRDELRSGRDLPSAVHHGWDRAKRTILVSDVVSLLAAVVLYFLAVGGVRGFAFTLGLTTVVDLIIVFLFTHPMLEMLSRRPFFRNGHRWSGLDPRRLGRPALYQGRGRVAGPAAAATAARPEEANAEGGRSTAPLGPAVDPATGRRLTIAERRALAARATRTAGSGEVPQPAPGSPATAVQPSSGGRAAEEPGARTEGGGS